MIPSPRRPSPAAAERQSHRIQKGASMSEPAERAWVPLTAPERRVLGVLVEKAKTTPDVYPLTLAAIVTGCNQKSNRDPLTAYDADDVEETLGTLRKKGAVILVEGGGRVVRYKHTLYEWLRVNKVELAVMAELLLRGPQTEGDLRARASRMEPLPDLGALQGNLDTLLAKDLIVYLSPPGTRRGVIVTHNLYPPKDLEREQARINQAPLPAAEPAPPPRRDPIPAPVHHAPPPAPALDPTAAREVAALRAEVDALRETVATLAAEVRELKAALGA